MYIDDLEIPSKKGCTIDQLYGIVLKNHGPDYMEQIKQSYIEYKTKRSNSFVLLSELERIFGIAKGFKYYWALASAQKMDTTDM